MTAGSGRSPDRPGDGSDRGGDAFRSDVPAEVLGVPVTLAEPVAYGPADREAGGLRHGSWFRVSHGHCTAWFPSCAHVEVRPDGVTIRPVPGVDPVRLAAVMLGPVAGIVATLAGHICLHATAVAVDGQAIVLGGPRGIGKSTTALAAVALGAAAVADDVAVLRRNDHTVTTAGHGRPLMVFPEDARSGGVDLTGPVADGVGKVAIPWGDTRPRVVSVVVSLERDESVRGPTVETLDGMDAISALHRLSYLRRVGDALDPRMMFAERVAVAEAVPVVRLRRPPAGCSAKQVAEVALSLMSGR
ncbi:MAG: hypothetical protein RIE08_07690 [Acidimicrobiales bacterium]